MKYKLTILAENSETPAVSCEIETEEKTQQIAITVLTAIRDMDNPKPRRKRRSDAGTERGNKTPA